MAEPIVLTKDGKTLVINAPSYAAQLVGEGWQVGEPNIVTAAGMTIRNDDAQVGVAVPDGAKATATPPAAPALPRGRPRKG